MTHISSGGADMRSSACLRSYPARSRVSQSISDRPLRRIADITNHCLRHPVQTIATCLPSTVYRLLLFTVYRCYPRDLEHQTVIEGVVAVHGGAVKITHAV